MPLLALLLLALFPIIGAAQYVCTPDSSCRNQPPSNPSPPFTPYPEVAPVPPGNSDGCNLTYADFVLPKSAGDAGVVSFTNGALNQWMDAVVVPDPAGTCRDTRINRFTWSHRNDARAAVLLSLLQTIQQSGSAAENAPLPATLQREIAARRKQAAGAAQSEYSRWYANPCTYGAPAGFAAYQVPAGLCSTGDVVSPTAPLSSFPLPPFARYGAATAYTLLNSQQGVRAATATVRKVVYILDRLQRGITFAPFANLTEIASRINNALGIIGSDLNPGINALGQLLPSAAIAVSAVTAGPLAPINTSNLSAFQAALPTTIAAMQTTPSLSSLLSNTTGLRELFGTFLEITLFDGPDPTLEVPAPSALSPMLTITSAGATTASKQVTFLTRDPLTRKFTPATMSLDRNWFALGHAGSTTAKLDFVLPFLDQQGVVRTARIVNGSFYTDDAGGATPNLSTSLLMRSADFGNIRVQLTSAALPAPQSSDTFLVSEGPSAQPYTDSQLLIVDWDGRYWKIQFDGSQLVQTPYPGNDQVSSTQIRYINWDGTLWSAVLNPTTRTFLLTRKGTLIGMVSNTVKFKSSDGGNWSFSLR